ATLSPHGVVSLVDLDTGGSFALRTNAVADSGLIASDHALMFATGIADDGRVRYDTLDLRIPHDAAALQHWLADITNAHDGAWP
ncbi:MAG TPA: hypothetical protein VFQ65_06925, partial [Kofleriaceae bacterium]|nr:hypothetical protein [Kofleriaceae bacterium]